ncbi:GAF and ANTAR domain-containing protein [Aeromicrobium sp. CF3.5]|uniref:GAF and ANTAR domain-containing protein n=1 Tax=Aeromicrobium sp. CF3.5 TaxID=3373078 RepID=UPI003EE4D548
MSTCDDQQVELFGQLAQTLSAETGWLPVMRHATQAAVELLESCDFASICEIDGAHQITTHACSDDLALRADFLQSKFNEGPIRAAAATGRPVHATDLHGPTPWPDWSAAAVGELDIRSALVLPLRLGRVVLGNLNIYGNRSSELVEDPITAAAALAAHVSVAMAADRALEHRDLALQHRSEIGQAQGMIMQRYGVSAAEAFAVLVRISQGQNIKLFMIAERVVTNGVDSISMDSASAAHP